MHMILEHQHTMLHTPVHTARYLSIPCASACHADKRESTASKCMCIKQGMALATLVDHQIPCLHHPHPAEGFMLSFSATLKLKFRIFSQRVPPSRSKRDVFPKKDCYLLSKFLKDIRQFAGATGAPTGRTTRWCRSSTRLY